MPKKEKKLNYIFFMFYFKHYNMTERQVPSSSRSVSASSSPREPIFWRRRSMADTTCSSLDQASSSYGFFFNLQVRARFQCKVIIHCAKRNEHPCVTHRKRVNVIDTLISLLRSRTTIVWPFFVYSKMAMFQAKK